MQKWLSRGIGIEHCYIFPRTPGTVGQDDQTAPKEAVFALAGEIVEALLADEKDGGYDLTAGLFGKNFSDLVRRLAAAELRANTATL